MEKGSVEERVFEILREQLMMTEKEVNQAKSNLKEKDLDIVDDLGADSLDVIEIIFQIEDEFCIEIPDEEAEKATTVKKAIDLIEKKLSQKSSE
ncbi:acyl carrier protein [Patescibacteria group bacterium]|nr:acyl carrier protein [Patescibacteria group bacterium]MBU4022900.1 acyl carrier protein [Patescibacteria group bacterium]MBU4078496.1 acyl carrier protein [Patescibacteria group bacterium]